MRWRPRTGCSIDGAILAVKGLGGFHLVCDAADEAVVTTLRKRKDRGDKPFAVMAADLDAARRIARDRRRPRRNCSPASGTRSYCCADGPARPLPKPSPPATLTSV